ncbi:MAG: hypothetical protein LAP39_27310 [Acidobacteriia bacterium]|nr:hypothetical protein [Terriglobia bacterium]
MTLRIFAVLMMGGAMLAAADQPAKNKKVTPIKISTPTKVQAVTIPADAVQIDPNTYNYTDPQGKKWVYHRTPFGISRVEDKPASPEDAKKAQEDRARLTESTKAVEDGDTIRFEQASPFGNTRWQRKKAELNEMERAVWERELEKRAARDSAPSASSAASASKD